MLYKDEKKSRKEKSSTQFTWHLLGSVVFSFAVTKEVWPSLLATLLWSRRIGVHQVLYVFALFFGGRLDANVVFTNGVFLRSDEFLNSLFTSAYRGLI